MSRFSFSARVGIGVAVVITAVAPIPGTARKNLTPPPTVDAPSSSTLHLRPAPDSQPSSMLGRFFPDGASIDDEMQAAQLSCSSYFQWEVADGGMRRQEVIEVDRSRAAALSIPAMASGGAKSVDSISVRVDYQQTAVMRAVVTDIDGLRDCCIHHACPDRYISSFVQGTAEVSSYQGSGGRGGIRGAPRGTLATADLQRDAAWQKAWSIDEPLYFAYTVGRLGPLVQSGVSSSKAAGTAQTIGCGAWVDLQPKDSADRWRVKGQYQWASSRREACLAAMADATHQVSLRSGVSTSGSMTLGSGGSLDVEVSAHTAGTYANLKQTHECVATRQTPEGDAYRCTVLVEVPVPTEPEATAPGSE